MRIRLRLITAVRVRLIRLAPVLLIVGCAACSRNDSLPRNMSLTAFNPHREAFECKHEADVVPRIDPEADRWNTRAIALTSSLLWPDQRDYRGAVELWAKAAERKHWKAMLNLANSGGLRSDGHVLHGRGRCEAGCVWAERGAVCPFRQPCSIAPAFFSSTTTKMIVSP